MKISYAITVVDELYEIINLTDFLLSHKQPQDEIVVLFDNKGTPEVKDYLRLISDLIIFRQKEFPNDFSSWKNSLLDICSKDSDYIFNIDADELITDYLVSNIPSILSDNIDIDVFALPRINTVSGITQEHLIKWGWKINEKGYINYPDLQIRIFKNKPEIRWVNKVHEMLLGFKSYAVFEGEDYALLHHKTIQRQEKQNNFYSNIK